MGYRGFDRDGIKPLFPFGYGLSYTTFSYSKPVVSQNGNDIVVETTVTNTGSVAGKEVVQVYVSAPRNKALPKPVKELKAFAKTRELKPGENEKLQMVIARQSLASWDESRHEWVVDAGTYTFHVAANADDLRSSEKIKL